MSTVNITASTSKPATATADALVLGIRTADDREGLDDLLDLMGFTGAAGQVAVFPSNGLVKAPLVAAIALPEEPSAEDLRRAAGRGVRALKNVTSVAIALHPADLDEVAAVAEGVHLATYRFTAFKSDRPDSDDTDSEDAQAPRELETVTLLTAHARQKAAADRFEAAATVGAAVNIARDWVNTPPGALRPGDFADAISEHAAETSDGDVDVTVWRRSKLERERCGGILGVGSGSDASPRLVQITYAPEGAQQHLALVGKGITFDSGGLSLKPGASMMTMKCDMAGAAAVAAAVVAIARLGLPIAVTGVVCLAENMPSGTAIRPGDVLTIRDGTTVEVHNTDAEGRLVLADGLVVAGEKDPDYLVDVATLTGAAVVALGNHTAGVLGNDEGFEQSVLRASTTAGESMWRLPITEEMKGLVTSSAIADLRQHNPKPAGGTLFAAAFLREFVGDVPWAHLDIAGPAFNDGSASDYTPVGGTGASVRTLVQLAKDLASA